MQLSTHIEPKYIHCIESKYMQEGKKGGEGKGRRGERGREEGGRGWEGTEGEEKVGEWME